MKFFVGGRNEAKRFNIKIFKQSWKFSFCKNLLPMHIHYKMVEAITDQTVLKTVESVPYYKTCENLSHKKNNLIFI